jgi:hypothetical protein
LCESCLLPNGNKPFQDHRHFRYREVCRYSEEQADELVVQMLDLADEAEFVIHVGDLRSAEDEDFRCRRTDYSDVAKMLRLSHAPAFIIQL